MPRPPAGTPEHWALARRLFEEGHAYAGIASQVAELGEGEDGTKPPSLGTIRRRAIDEDWQRADNRPETGSLGPARQTLEERTARVAAYKLAGEMKLEQRLQLLAEQLGEACAELVAQMFQPVDLVEVKVVPRGAQMGSEVEVVRERLAEPVPKDKQALATAASQLIDRLQLLTGGATSRTEAGPIADRAQAEAKLRMVRDELRERREAQEAQEGAPGATG